MSVYKWSAPSMGGRLTIAISAESESSDDALADAALCGRRVNAWANRLTRFNQASDLSRLNASSSPHVAVRPTLGAVLDWARIASDRTNGIADATLLHARLGAEHSACAPKSGADWRISFNGGRAGSVAREPGIGFDLDGLAKGWLADRAADLLAEWPGVAVDADGDIALRADVDVEWLIDVADPRPDAATDAPLATLRVSGGSGWTRCYGVATSGTSIHRWRLADGRETHHLIDPRTGLSAETDIVQATVIAPTAREAEVIAKTAVILGSRDALDFLSESAAHTALLLLESGDLACLPGVDRWLA